MDQTWRACELPLNWGIGISNKSEEILKWSLGARLRITKFIRGLKIIKRCNFLYQLVGFDVIGSEILCTDKSVFTVLVFPK